MILGLSAGLAVSQDDPAKPGDNAKPADNTKAAKNANKDYGVLFGTVYGPDDRPLYGVRVTIHPVGKKHPSWDLHSDHRGEFAQRVPPAPADYLVTGEVEIAPLEKGKAAKKKHLKGEAKVHMGGAEWHDFSLHLEE
jgi:hypothetical protein